ncbi:MalY/PatB family protein [Oenococcus oeni]|uniref:MalY/PatB family protein n=1 Tax=Oenococcus oeni TaxID=1247 RepID=UPI0015D66252|nr:PatB family C-S lyase [Oenococcus oeni]
MMRYDFDQLINRHNTYSTQWDYISDRFGRNDILPFSISDTDFAVPKEIQDAVRQRIEHPIYGYTRWNHEDYKQNIVDWFKKRNRVNIEPDWIAYSPSVVFTISTFIRMMSNEGDTVAVFSPMYDAFYGAIEKNDRFLAPVRLGSAQEGYVIDWDSLTTILSQPRTKILLLTNPHNPTGKVFTRQELYRISELCDQYHIFMISDDIHRDIVYKPNHYCPLTEVRQHQMVLCCSASKTFNTPGLIGSYLFEPDTELYRKFLIELKQKNALSSVSIFGMISQMAAYKNGSEYVDQMVDYLHQNLLILNDFLINQHLNIDFVLPQGTYLAWLKVDRLGYSANELQNRLVNKGKVGIMSGKTYGDSNYLRMNIACPRKKLLDGLKRLRLGLAD